MKTHSRIPHLGKEGRPLALALTLAALTSLTPVSLAQYAERGDWAGSGSPAVDVSGRSVKNPRVRAIHSDDASQEGTTAWMFERDPFLAYMLGRNLNFREFRKRDGVFTNDVADLGGPMPDGTTAKITKNNHTSCLGCHNLPNGNPGGGANFSKDAGLGRNSPHYYGGGVMEMLALQIRRDILAEVDANQDGWVSAAEAASGPGDILIEPRPGAAPIHFGDCRLSGDDTGVPGLNNIFRVWYVDAQGQHVDGATQVDGVTTFGYNFALTVWGWGQGPGRAALNPTNRVFLWDPFVAHSGLDAYDPSTTNDPDGDGVSLRTQSGAEQFPATHTAPDEGLDLDPLGFSRDDPDEDGYLNEISEGDLDLAEWFMLNAPRPAFAGTPAQYAEGVAALEALNCTSCHVADWRIEGRGQRHPGDRRFFDLDVSWNAAAGRLEGKLVKLYRETNGRYQRRFRPFEVEGIFTDLAHHDMGEGFEEIDFSGTRNTLWRTPPLWGVGSGFPWGHDGASLTLRDAILRHGGEAAASRAAFVADEARADQVLDFLERLVLYDIESLPTDLDGDGFISPGFMVAGKNTGEERFQPEWLFRVPVEIQGNFVNVDGQTVRSFAALNLVEAYGLDLDYRRDSDLDGWPDVWDAEPFTAGYKDGVN